MAADHKQGAHEFQVNTLTEERAAIDERCYALPPGSAAPAEWKEGSPSLPRGQVENPASQACCSLKISAAKFSKRFERGPGHHLAELSAHPLAL